MDYIIAFIAFNILCIFFGYTAGDLTGFLTGKGEHPLNFWMCIIASLLAVEATYVMNHGW